MASALVALSLNSPSYTTALRPQSLGHSHTASSSPSTITFGPSFKALPTKGQALHQHRSSNCLPLKARSDTFDFAGSFFERGFGDEDDDLPSTSEWETPGIDEKPECPPGLRQYETMAVLRPDMSENERLGVTQKYEEMLVAGGGMYVEVFNRGVIPLAYAIKKRNKAGESNTYLDGIYLLFTYFTNQESVDVLETTLKKDDDVIRSSTFKFQKKIIQRYRAEKRRDKEARKAALEAEKSSYPV